ncbi:hypothetical protein H1R20_g12812, partial [Candolleomyces eurysporus]
MASLFSPIKVGKLNLEHRVVLAPLTRFRATRTAHVPVVPLVKEYYTQRASIPGTLLITEAVLIAPEAAGYFNFPGIWSEDQIKAWKEIADAVHAKGSYIYLQIAATGRVSHPEVLAEEGGYPYIAPSPIPLSNRPPEAAPPRALTIPEIEKYINLHAKAAKNAVDLAGFDGVEVHCGNGCLIDQFLQDVSNTRTDEYGGTIESRSRFGLRVVDAVIKAVGQERTGVRVNPWGRSQDMGMKDPIPQFSHFVSSLASHHSDLAYLHVIEPLSIEERLSLNGGSLEEIQDESIDFLRKIWSPRPFISCGGYNRENAIEAVAKDGGSNGLIAFGQLFIANPDLPFRLHRNLPLTTPDPSTFYTPADVEGTEKGYIDYPFSKEYIEALDSKSADKLF